MSLASESDGNIKLLKAILRLFLVVFFNVLLFYIASLLFLSLAQLADNGINDQNILIVEEFVGKLFANPLFLWDAYKEWAVAFVQAFNTGNFSFGVFIPLLAPLLLIIVTFVVFARSTYPFRLWYRFNNRYAELDDIKNMGLFEGHLMALGRFGEHILKLKRCFSVLCLGSTDCGKTSGVAIPSILESDRVCIVASDKDNELARYTSGYRSQLGKVFYFNWNLRDDPLKNEFYPRWNPLSAGDMPAKGESRGQYLSDLTRYLVTNNRDNAETDQYWERLAMVAMDGILNFFIEKIEQASANDYFLSEMLEKGRLSKDDKDLLHSYYVGMSKKYSLPAIKNLELGKFDMSNYLPIGSWEGVPKAWQGKGVNLSMFSDWLIQSYFAVKVVAEKPEIDGWKIVIERWLEEAKFFGYNEQTVDVLQQMFYLSRKQRSIVFPMVINPLSVFRNSNVRERTSTSDFYLYQSRGIKNPETGKWEVVTIYNIAGNKSVDFMGKLFIDMLIEKNIVTQKGYGPYPLLFVIDDIEQQPRYESLVEGLVHGPHSRMSFLLLSDYVKMLNDKYGTETLEEIVSNATYKLMMADKARTVAWKFENLAVYGTKSVQIPASDSGVMVKAKRGLTDASYYKIIAKNLYSDRRYKMEVGDEFLIAAGYYHLPIKLRCLYFPENEWLKEKAMMNSTYLLDEEIEKKRNVQDIDTPSMLEVLHDVGLNLQTEEDINIYLEDKYEEAIETRQIVADKQAALADDISNRWKSRKFVHAQQQDKEWWLEEDSFSFSAKEDVNPFSDKK